MILSRLHIAWRYLVLLLAGVSLTSKPSNSFCWQWRASLAQIDYTKLPLAPELLNCLEAAHQVKQSLWGEWARPASKAATSSRARRFPASCGLKGMESRMLSTNWTTFRPWLSGMSGAAPASRSCFTMPMCEYPTAMCRGVYPAHSHPLGSLKLTFVDSAKCRKVPAWSQA